MSQHKEKYFSQLINSMLKSFESYIYLVRHIFPLHFLLLRANLINLKVLAIYCIFYKINKFSEALNED